MKPEPVTDSGEDRKFHSFLLGARPVRRARMRSEPGDMFRRSAVQALGSDEA